MFWDQLWPLRSWSLTSVSCALNYFLFWWPIFPLIVIVAVAMGFGYQYFAAFYRASAREVKRLGVSIRMTIFLNSYSHFADSMLRSLLYSHLSESLTGQIRFILWHLSLISFWQQVCQLYAHTVKSPDSWRRTNTISTWKIVPCSSPWRIKGKLNL